MTLPQDASAALVSSAAPARRTPRASTPQSPAQPSGLPLPEDRIFDAERAAAGFVHGLEGFEVAVEGVVVDMARNLAGGSALVRVGRIGYRLMRTPRWP